MGRITNGAAGLFCAFGSVVAGGNAIESFSGSTEVSVGSVATESVDAATETPGAVNDARQEGFNSLTDRQSDVLLGIGYVLISAGGAALAFKGGQGALVDPKKGI